MESLKLVILCFILSLTVQEYSFKKIDNTSVIYAVDNKVFTREFSEHSKPKKLVEFKATVSGLAMYDDHLYVSVERPQFTSEKDNSFIWRVKK